MRSGRRAGVEAESVTVRADGIGKKGEDRPQRHYNGSRIKADGNVEVLVRKQKMGRSKDVGSRLKRARC